MKKIVLFALVAFAVIGCKPAVSNKPDATTSASKKATADKVEFTVPDASKTYEIQVKLNDPSLKYEFKNVKSHQDAGGLIKIVPAGTTFELVAPLGSLSELTAQSTGFTGIKLEGCQKLTKLSVDGNALTELHVNHLKGLELLECGGNKFEELTIKGLHNLKSLSVSQIVLFDPSPLKKISLTDLPNLDLLNLSNNSLTDIDIPASNYASSILVYKNKLSKDALIKILKALPDYMPPKKAMGSGPAIAIVMQNDSTNFHDFTDADVKQAIENAKNNLNWRVTNNSLSEITP